MAESAVPMTGKILYRPRRLMIWPLEIDATNSPAINGRMFSPELVALAPSTSCRNTGRNVIAPNIANPITKPTPLATLKTWMRKSRNGRIGSDVRRSTTTKPASITTPMIPRPTICSEAHG
jgi:hypothetical protein